MQVANLLNYNLNQQFVDKLPHDEVIQRMKNGMLCYNIISHGMPKVIAPSARAAQDFEVRHQPQPQLSAQTIISFAALLSHLCL